MKPAFSPANRPAARLMVLRVAFALSGIALLALPFQDAFAALTIEVVDKAQQDSQFAAPAPRSPKASASLHLPESSVPIIRATGIIEAGDNFRIRAALALIKAESERVAGAPLAIVELDSPGGDMVEGLALGYLFREFDVATVVRKGRMCLSACAMAFLGGTVSHLPPDIVPGRKVEVGGIVGFHNFYLNPQANVGGDAGSWFDAVSKGFSLAESAAAGFAHYVTFMGVEPGFIARILARPINTWEYVDSAGQFLEFSACPIGLVVPQVPPEVLAANICGNALGVPIGPENVQSVSPSDFKRRLLDRIRANVMAFRIRASTADKMAKALAGDDDHLVDEVYDEVENAGVPLPGVLGQSFRVTGRDDSGDYLLQCHISLSTEEAGTFDLVIDGPGGLNRSLQSVPSVCPSLFAFKREDLLNPSPVIPPYWQPPAKRN